MSIQDRNQIIGKLAAEYRDALTRYFLRRSFDMDEAEEMTNELFFRLVLRLNSHPHENPKAFLFHCAANLIKDRYRRTRARRTFAASKLYHEAQNIEVISPERVLDGKQTLNSVLEALDKLDPRSRDMFLLHRVEGLKHAEIAKVYGISVSAVEKHVMKCLAQIVKLSQGGA